MHDFLKYQSLGNDFVVYDWLEQSDSSVSDILVDPTWPQFVQELCHRRFGVGADGVLIIRRKQTDIEVLMFNPDGGQAEKCLNGLRCVVHYLKSKNLFSAEIEVVMGGDKIIGSIAADLVSLQIDNIKYGVKHSVHIAGREVIGHVVSVGNPHFVILGQISQEWFEQYVREIAIYKDFPGGTNVELITQNGDDCSVVVYERGVGMTLSCGSGAAAVMTVLKELRAINCDAEVTLHFLGGDLYSVIYQDDSVLQRAPANSIFSAALTLDRIL